MAWFRRILLTLPFAVAAALTILMQNADRLHLIPERIAGYGFAFGTPWAWLLDRGWVPDYHHHTLQLMLGYAVILWIPALLYSGCLWLLFLGFARLRTVTSRKRT